MEIAGNGTVRMLHCLRMNDAEQQAVIAEAAASGHPFEMCGWRAAERNLDFLLLWPVVWLARLVGCGPTKEYLRRGGMEGMAARILHMPHSPWRIVLRRQYLGGVLVTLRAEKKAIFTKKA